MAKLFLHIGLHKTASSSFQLSCDTNRSELLKQNIVYPLFDCLNTNHQQINNHSIPLFSLFTSHPEHYPVNLRWNIQNIQSTNDAYREQLNKFLNKEEDLLISGEDISSLQEEELNRLLEYLTNSGREIVAYACIRSPYDFHCSQVQQQVKDGVAMNTVGLCPQRHRIAKLIQVFGKSLHWIPFAEACHHPQGPVGSLLNVCGIDSSKFFISNSNEGRSAELVRIQNLLNHQQPRIRANSLNPKHISLLPFQGSRFLLQPEELAEITDHLNTENAALNELLGPGFCDLNRQTASSTFASSYPALTYCLTALIGLLLQQQTSPTRTRLSLHEVQHFLLKNCDETALRKAILLDSVKLIELLLEPKTTIDEFFPETLVPLAQQFINCL